MSEAINQSKIRNSQIEVFRIIVTLLVLIVHFNGYFAGLDVHKFNFYNSGQIVIEALSCVAVNGFILISGFFGLRFRIKSIWKIYLILFSIYFPLFILESVYHASINTTTLLNCVLPISSGENYYVNGYVQLILFSPFLNMFAQKMGSKVWKYSLLLIVLGFYFDCLWSSNTFGYKEGYSGIHFVTIYMVGRAIFFNQGLLSKFKRIHYIFLYILLTFVIVIMSYMKVPWAYNYTNPVMILSATSLFLFFVLGKPFYSKVINGLAGCSLTAYILQISNPLETYLVRADKYLLNNYHYIIYLLLSIAIVISFYLFSYLWDRVRILIYSIFSCKIEGFIDRIDEKVVSFYK